MFHRPKAEEKDTEQQVSRDQAPVEQYVAEQKQPAQPSYQPEQKHVVTQEEKTMNNEQTTPQNTEERAQDTTAGVPFQRPPHMQRAVPGGYAAGGYPGAAGTNSAASREAGEDRRLVIGQGITMSGEIEACDYLLVEGTLEAALKGAKVLDVAESGTFYGAVEIEEATIAGRFEGELTVSGRLTIKEGGSVTGAVTYRELAIEAGATLDGKVSPMAAAGAAHAETPKKAMAPRNDNSGREDAAETGSELPFGGDARAAAAE